VLSNLILAISITLAQVIAGEAGDLCGLSGKLAVAHVWQNRIDAGIAGGWYGNAQPTPTDYLVAEMFRKLPDPTRGATFLINTHDAQKPSVQAWLFDKQLTARFTCAGGLDLLAYR
jgi:hypothetical protein